MSFHFGLVCLKKVTKLLFFHLTYKEWSVMRNGKLGICYKGSLKRDW